MRLSAYFGKRLYTVYYHGHTCTSTAQRLLLAGGHRSVCRPRPASHAHFRYRQACGFNNSKKYILSLVDLTFRKVTSCMFASSAIGRTILLLRFSWCSWINMCNYFENHEIVITAALRSRCGHYIFVLWFLSIFLLSFFLFSPNLSGRRLDVYHTSTYGVALVRI